MGGALQESLLAALKLQLNSHTSNDSLSPALGTYLFFVSCESKKNAVDIVDFLCRQGVGVGKSKLLPGLDVCDAEEESSLRGVGHLSKNFRRGDSKKTASTSYVPYRAYIYTHICTYRCVLCVCAHDCVRLKYR